MCQVSNQSDEWCQKWRGGVPLTTPTPPPLMPSCNIFRLMCRRWTLRTLGVICIYNYLLVLAWILLQQGITQKLCFGAKCGYLERVESKVACVDKHDREENYKTKSQPFVSARSQSHTKIPNTRTF